jgi:ferredoxin
VSVEIHIDYDLCESNAVCQQFAPDVFEVRDEDDKLYVLQPNPPEELREAVLLAAERCPRQAITVKD